MCIRDRCWCYDLIVFYVIHLYFWNTQLSVCPVSPATVSYTHLDVYKRQLLNRPVPLSTFVDWHLFPVIINTFSLFQLVGLHCLMYFRRTAHPRNCAVLSMDANWRLVARFQCGQNPTWAWQLAFSLVNANYSRLALADQRNRTWYSLCQNGHLRARTHSNAPGFVTCCWAYRTNRQLGVSKVHIAY